MKTLTPEQRIEGFTELEGVLGEGGVGGAHLMSFLAGIAHAEKVLAEPKQDEEPFGYVSEHTTGGYYFHRKHSEIYWDTCVSFHKVFLHPAPRPEPTQGEGWRLREVYFHADGEPGMHREPAPRPEFVRLSEEELRSCFTETNEAEPLAEGWPGLERFAQAIEDALEGKNRG